MTPSPRGKGRPARGAPLLRSGLTRRGSAEYVVAAIHAASHGHRRRRSTMTDETDGRREFLKGALAVGGGAAALGAVGVPQAQAQPGMVPGTTRSEEHTSELQSLTNLVCRLLLDKKDLATVTSD